MICILRKHDTTATANNNWSPILRALPLSREETNLPFLVYIIHLLVNIPLKISHNIKKNNDCTTWSSRTSNFHFKKSTNLLKISISIIHIYIIQHTSYVKCYKPIWFQWNGKKQTLFRDLRTFFLLYILAFFKYIHGKNEVTVKCASNRAKKIIYIFILYIYNIKTF